MTKKQLAELIQHAACGGNMNSDLKAKFHLEIIYKWIELFIADIESDIEIKSRWGEFASFNKNVKRIYPVAVTLDTDLDKYYSILPASIVNKTRDRGIISISPIKDESFNFWWREPNCDRIFKRLLVNTQSDRPPSWSKEANKIFYSEHMTIDWANVGVMFRINAAFSELDDDDEISLPTGNGGAISDAVIAHILGKYPEKQTNDNTSKPVV